MINASINFVQCDAGFYARAQSRDPGLPLRFVYVSPGIGPSRARGYIEEKEREREGKRQ